MIRTFDIAKVIVNFAVAILACVCFVSIVLWATGWAALLPEPVRSASASVALVVTVLWVLVAAVVLLVVGGRHLVASRAPSKR
ncbi:MAG: hypothetical protein ACRDLL_03345 [Solirubrobacterales bacterium]